MYCFFDITGFGVKYSISAIVDKQYGEIFNYDFIAMIKDDDPQEQKDEIRLIMETQASTFQLA